MIYFATPYTHEDPAVREKRYREAVATTYRLTVTGHKIFSPIIATHDMVVSFNMAFWYKQWEGWCHDFISSSTMFLVGCMEDWEASSGVNRELEFAKSIGMPIRYLWRDDLNMPDADLETFEFHETPQPGTSWPV